MEVLTKNSSFTEEEIAMLNEEYESLSPQLRLNRLYQEFPVDSIMVTSSFAATSALLLKLVSDVCPSQKIHFIDTGYHFKETLEYRAELENRFDLNVESAEAEDWKHQFTLKDKTWEKDPNLCCSINKVEPLDAIKVSKKIWISGLMKWQSEHRSSLNVFEERSGILKFYPLLDVTKEVRDQFIQENDLPFHPLVEKGYASIGCFHCTKPGNDRDGRWNNNPKTECGLHL